MTEKSLIAGLSEKRAAITKQPETSMTQRRTLTGREIALLCVFGGVCIGITTLALATPPFGIVLNQIVAKGTALADISEILHVGSDPNTGGENRDAENEDWLLHVRSLGATDFYVQHLVVGPGGSSGWHTHPGLLIGTVVSGSIDFYDANCQKRSFTAGQVFTENTEVHAIINTGEVNADLSIAYLIKHNLPRRIEADPPACAPSTGIP